MCLISKEPLLEDFQSSKSLVESTPNKSLIPSLNHGNVPPFIELALPVSTANPSITKPPVLTPLVPVPLNFW